MLRICFFVNTYHSEGFGHLYIYIYIYSYKQLKQMGNTCLVSKVELSIKKTSTCNRNS